MDSPSLPEAGGRWALWYRGKQAAESKNGGAKRQQLAAQRYPPTGPERG